MTYQRSDYSEAEVLGQRYEIVRQLREEPWGGVWLAQDRLLGAEVALKLLPRDIPEAVAVEKTFEQEAILGLTLRHPQILGVFHLEKTEKISFLVEEPFRGESLQALLSRQHRFSLPQALQLLEQVSQAMAFAHQLGVAHRSLNPCHILVMGEEVRVANFAFPPPDGDQPIYLELKAYDPPEVVYGDHATPAGNIFSLGVLGFRLAAGSLPYPLTFDEPFPYRLEIPPGDLDEIPIPLQNVLLRCLAEEPEERLPHAAAFLEQLRQAREMMRGARREAYPAWKTDSSRKGRQPAVQAAAQAATQAWALLSKAGSAVKPGAQKLGKGLRTCGSALKIAPRRLWWGLGLVGLMIMLVAVGVKMVSRLPSRPQPQPTVAAAPVQLPLMGGGPPLVESGEPAKPGEPAHPAKPPGETKPGSLEERYMLVAATYANRPQAQALYQRLRGQKFPAKIVARTTAGKTLYQVQVGPVAGLQGAEEVARRITSQENITPKIVKMAPRAAKTAKSRRTAR